jgi:protein-L-isoaspartate(D-aspartate) O-methyltransferase
MESYSNNKNFSCKICYNNYDESTRLPKAISCGHTLCDTCIKGISSKSSNSNYECPFCKKTIQKSFEPIIIYELIPESPRRENEKKENLFMCPIHSDLLIFFCINCNHMICKDCVLKDHSGHKIGEGDIKIINKTKSLIDEIEVQLNKDDNSNMETSRTDTMNQLIRESLDTYLDNINILSKVKPYNFTVNKEKILFIKKKFNRAIYDKCYNREILYSSLEDSFKLIKSNIDFTDSDDLKMGETWLLKYIMENNDKLIQSSKANFENLKKLSEIENIKDYLTTLDSSLIKYKSCRSARNNDMYKPIFEIHKFENKNNESIFLSIDRKDFCPDESIHECYEEEALDIGCNTYLPYPEGPVLRLYYISKFFKVARGYKRALDIGSGSGFLTLCLSKFLGPNSTTFGIDHFEEIVNYSKEAINTNHSQYLESGRIKLLVRDGFKGLPEEGPFDIIHFGAACKEIPNVIIDQLEIGGIVLIPLGTDEDENKILSVAIKDQHGNIKITELYDIDCDSLTSKEAQLEKFE